MFPISLSDVMVEGRGYVHGKGGLGDGSQKGGSILKTQHG